MQQKTFNFFYAFLLAILGFGITLMAEDITLTTYYPAPYGAYDELTTTGNTYLATTSGKEVGIGTTDPGAKVDIVADDSVIKPFLRLYDTRNSVGSGNASIFEVYNTFFGRKLFDITGGGTIQQYSASNGTVVNSLASNGNSYITAGNVGIGTTNPGTYRLNVNGDVIVNKIYTQQATNAHGQGHNFNDIAEYINVRLEDGLELGDVVSIDSDVNETARRSSKDYDLAVAGIISSEDTAAFIIGKDKEAGSSKKLLALAGRVRAKVTILNGPIKRGDLLTTSSTPGHAMKATDRDKSFGAIVGKALEPFDGGPNGEKTGEILILIALQ